MTKMALCRRRRPCSTVWLLLFLLNHDIGSGWYSARSVRSLLRRLTRTIFLLKGQGQVRACGTLRSTPVGFQQCVRHVRLSLHTSQRWSGRALPH